MLYRIYLLFMLIAPLALTGCDIAGLFSGATLPEEAGPYETITFTLNTGAETLDIAAAGAGVTLTLNADGTVQGRLFVPGTLPGLEDPGDLDLPFAGTYRRSGDTVTFDHAADTFLRDAAFTFDGSTLQAQTDEVLLVLEKQ